MLTLTQPSQTTIDYRITTPMFLGGAKPQEVDATQFRNASFKGALRFWWRALHWGQFLREAQGDVAQALKNLHHKEGALFGKASDGNDSRQSAVRVQSKLKNVQRNNAPLSGIAYLLGQGLTDRQYLTQGSLCITLQYACALPADDIASIERAAIALGLFGGLGSRSRKGLGSLAIQSLQREQGGEPKDAKQFGTINAIEAFVKEELDFSAPASPLPPFTAFSQACRIDISCQDNDAVKTLETIKHEMQMYRSWGKNGKVNGLPSEKNFQDDHDLIRDALRKEASLNALPRRSAFGLPHNYFFSSLHDSRFDKMEISPKGQTKEKGRRASPLFIHIHAIDNSKYIAIQTFIPAIFLHQEMVVEVEPAKGRSKGRARFLKNTKIEYNVIHDYLNRFKEKPNYKELRRHG
ncbi:MAG: type III-B CRISPR module RAMP protein Cmr1 [Comamonadaceae bacterium]|nr:type III-B CRISPR module RAMP protein Cmr1 [Comamonadaceae bacterium]